MPDNLKVCIDCGDLAVGTRCPTCQAARDRRVGLQRGGANARGYDYDWQRRAAKVKHDQPECVVCGATDDLTVDHVIPKARGGTDDLDNLVTMCRRHNSAKGGRA